MLLQRENEKLKANVVGNLKKHQKRGKVANRQQNSPWIIIGTMKCSCGYKLKERLEQKLLLVEVVSPSLHTFTTLNQGSQAVSPK